MPPQRYSTSDCDALVVPVESVDPPGVNPATARVLLHGFSPPNYIVCALHSPAPSFVFLFLKHAPLFSAPVEKLGHDGRKARRNGISQRCKMWGISQRCKMCISQRCKMWLRHTVILALKCDCVSVRCYPIFVCQCQIGHLRQMKLTWFCAGNNVESS